MNTPWLADDEVDSLCDPLRQNAAKVKYLRGLGLTVREKPNGRPLVLRSNVEDVLGALPGRKRPARAERQPVQPDTAGLVLAFSASNRKG